MLRFEDLRVRDQQELDRDFFNRRFRLIAETFGQLGQEVASVTGDTDRLVALGLTRVNEVLGPLLSKVQAVSENGFLVATSATSLTIVNGLQSTLAITDPAQRDLFSPTPYVLLTRQAEGTQDDYAVLCVEDFNRTNGGLAFEVVLVNGGIGDTAEEAAEAAATAEAVLASGPVSSVNGKTGVVVLGMSDIAGLVSTLAAKADGSHGHAISQISNLQATLNAISDGGSY
jgi:hypothetical protein